MREGDGLSSAGPEPRVSGGNLSLRIGLTLAGPIVPFGG